MKCKPYKMLAVLLVLTTTAFAATTWYVNGVSGSDSNSCLSATTACKTIGHAISLASSGDTIMIAPATYTECLTISISLSVIGSGAGTTIIDGQQGSTVVTISNTAAQVSLSKVTIRNGFGHNGMGGGIYNSGTLTISKSTISRNGVGNKLDDGQGGGIFNVGALTVNNSTIANNGAGNPLGKGGQGGGVWSNGTLTVNHSAITNNGAYGPGGGVWSNGVLMINNSTVSKNVVTGEGGGILSTGGTTINNSMISGNRSGGKLGKLLVGLAGGIEIGGTATINNSTVSGNSTAGSAGGIYISGETTAIIINSSTISGNSANHGGGIEIGEGTAKINSSTVSGNSATDPGGAGGGGIDNFDGTVTLQNTIVANSTSGGNCSGTMTSSGYNLSSDATCAFNGRGDMNSTDPMLGPLQHNGGPTQTMALPSGSPAIDAGNPAGCTDGLGHLLKTDQRGKPRPDKEDTGGCDIGAYESQAD